MSNEFTLILPERDACFLAQHLNAKGIKAVLEPQSSDPGWFRVSFSITNSYELLQVYHAGINSERSGGSFAEYVRKYEAPVAKPADLPF